MDALDPITRIINSPPGQLVAGGTLAAIVWKFFERVEAVLNENTKHEVARWLKVKSVNYSIVTEDVASWPETFGHIFDRAFGVKHISWHCFWRSAVASISVSLLAWILSDNPSIAFEYGGLARLARFILLINIPVDYLSLLKTRRLLRLMSRHDNTLAWASIIAADILLTYYLANSAFVSVVVTDTEFWSGLPDSLTDLLGSLRENWIHPLTNLRSVLGIHHWMFIFPAFVASIWLWLYGGSGFLLKAARQFNTGFDWFNRTFNIDKKPLQSIGLVAGSIVAFVYWAAAIIVRMVG